MSGGRRFAIDYSPATGKAVAGYVTRGFFSLREFPQACARMVLTGEFWLFAGIPLLLLVVAHFLRQLFDGMLSQALTAGAVLWLIAGLVRIIRYGRSTGIGAYVLNPDGSPEQLVGGLRMRLQRRGRIVWIAGLLVEPDWRGSGIGTALVLAALRLALRETVHDPVTFRVFAPSHPASRAIITKQLGGLRTLAVTTRPSDALKRTLQNLEQALARTGSSFDWRLADLEQSLFSKTGQP